MATLETIAFGMLYLDTNIFVYWLEDYTEFRRVLTNLFARLKRGELRAVTSELTLAECLVKPIMDRNETRQAAFQQALVSSNELLIQPVSRDVLVEAAHVRAAFRVTLPDAIHVATARVTTCETFLTNDRRLRTPPGLTVVTLADLAQS